MIHYCMSLIMCAGERSEPAVYAANMSQWDAAAAQPRTTRFFFAGAFSYCY